MLRGIAALLVVYRHLFETYWFNKEFNGNLIGDKNFEFIHHLSENIFVQFASYTWKHFRSSWGTIGVGLFFLISGFVISFSISKRDSAHFILNRILRIYPVVFFVLLLDIIYLYSYNYIYQENHLYSIPWKDCFFNATLILRFLNNSPFIDPVLWTLEVELLFYIIVSCLTKLHIQNPKTFLAIYIFILVLSLILPLASTKNNLYINNILLFIQNSLPHLSMMFIGVYFYNLYTKNWRLNIKYISIFLSIIVIQYAYKYYYDKNFIVYISSYSIALLIWCFTYNFRDQLKHYSILNFFASISYSLYLNHQLLGYILITLFLKQFNEYISSLLSFVSAIILGGGYIFVSRKKGHQME